MSESTAAPMPAAPARAGLRRGLGLMALFALELGALAGAYQFLAVIDCGATGAMGACNLLRSFVLRALVLLAAGAVLVRARPAAFRAFLAEAAAAPPRVAWVALHVAGLAAMALPLALWAGEDLAPHFARAARAWVPGGLMAAAGGFLWLAPGAAWARLARREGRLALPVAAVALVLPDLAEAVRPVWDIDAITMATFAGVAVLLYALGAQPFAMPDARVIGVEDFSVHIAPQCSGVEGVALVTAFLLLYAAVFRAELRPGRFLAVVVPLGIVASWALNAVRIAVLILIGAGGAPGLAVNGFHSYAGWLFFTLLALALVGLVQVMPWLHRNGLRAAAAPMPPLRHDPVAAAILPFVAFMVASIATAAAFDPPDLGYPLKAAVLALAVAAFAPVWRGLSWRPDLPALAAGLAVGLGWVALAGPADAGLAAVLAGLAPAALAGWIAARVAGTVLLVPLVEEAFFRGYVLARLDGPGWRRPVAVAASTAAFALLHGRWVEAVAAGLVFAAVALARPGGLAAAVQAHMAANATVAAAALLRGDFSLI